MRRLLLTTMVGAALLIGLHEIFQPGASSRASSQAAAMPARDLGTSAAPDAQAEAAGDARTVEPDENNVATATTATTSTTSATPTRFELIVCHGKLIGGPRVLRVEAGDRVAISVRSDVAEEVHLHGYDRKLEVPAGAAATLEFIADRSGRFEYELEHSSVVLGALEVRPHG